MKHLQVTADELQKHVADTVIDVCGDFGEGYHASVQYVVGHGMYHVYDHGALIMSTTSAATAAETFNSIRRRPVSGVTR